MEKPAPPQSANRSGKSTPTKRKDDDVDEEAQRLLLEQEEKERKIEAKKKLEEARLESLNSVREKQEQETEEELNNMRDLVSSLKSRERLDPEWERYTRCDGNPDPTSLTQINTFISLTRSKSNADMNLVLEEAKLVLSLLNELMGVLDDADQTQTPEQEAVYKETMLSLQGLLLSRYNHATLKLLQEASYEADSETGNLQKVIKGTNEVLMLWGNLNKNPRFKSFEFDEEKFQFELPKALTMADIAVRVLKTSFDHYSHRCSSFNPKEEKPVEVPEVDVEEEKNASPVEEAIDDNDGNNEEKDDGDSVVPPSGRKSQMSATSDKIENEDQKASKDKLDHVTPEPGPEEAEMSEKKLDVALEEILDPDVVDLRQFHPLGGIYHIDLLEMPPQPKSVKGWVLTQITETPLTSMKYPSDLPAKARSRAPSAVGESREGGTTPSKTPVEQIPPIGISMQLPHDVMFLEEPQVAMWDPKDSHWKTKDISDPTFDEEKRTLSFKSSGFGVFSLSQDAHLNMPFQSWELKPKSVDSTLLTITGAIVEVEIEIKGTQCRLNPPDEGPPSELSHIHGRWMEPDALVAAMRNAGVNMFPATDSHKFVSVQKKEVELGRVYEQIGILSSNFAFSWSKWSNEAPSSQVVFQAAPFVATRNTTQPQPVPDDDWSAFVASDDRCYRIAVSEFDDAFSDDIASECEYHCDVLHAVRSSSKKLGAQVAAERSRSSDAPHADTVTRLLKASNLVMYS